MTKQLPPLGELELAVLRLVWEHQPCTERQVWEAMQTERDLARTTVLKTIQRLEAKKCLTRLPNTSPVEFCAVLEEKLALSALVHRFVETVLGGSADPLVAYFANSNCLSEKDLSALKAIAKKLHENHR
ncbi:MAG: BlaI/MecI/CopY family transcriptional regulator [Planctomycetaceae bacterium]